MSGIAGRRYAEELASFVGKKVKVECSDGKVYGGSLLAISEGLDVVLGNPTDLQGIGKVLINGSMVSSVKLDERVFDLKELADRISKIFPGNVTFRDDIGAIFVMNRIKVTEAGVVEGSGPAADKVRKIYDDYVQEMREKEREKEK